MATETYKIVDLSLSIKQEPYINDEGIWMPCNDYVPEGCVSSYKLVMTKEMFIEAYNNWIKNDKSTNKF